MRQRLLVSVSTGRSSNFMAHWLKENKSDEYEMMFVCANTSREHEDSIRFQRAADRHFGLGLIWVQAIVHPGERKASTHEVVGDNSLAMDGSVFERVIGKYGIPNHAYPHCTRELKINPIHDYAESVWGTDYLTAIGIRADEPDRIRADAEAEGIVYPLAHWRPTKKPEILETFGHFPWDLKVEEYETNCVECFKKTDTKLNAAFHRNPDYFVWLDRMERRHGHIKTEAETQPGPRRSYRKFRSAADMMRLFEYLGPPPRQLFDPEASGGCAEACEADAGARGRAA